MSDILDSPESLLPNGHPKWGTSLSGNKITYNFMPALPREYFFNIKPVDPDPTSFAPFTSQQQTAAEGALSVWAEIADVRFEQQEDSLIQLVDVFDTGLIGEVLDFLGLYDNFANALDNFINDRIEDLVGFRIFFPIVKGGDIRFGTSDLGNGISGVAYPPPPDWDEKFDELRLDIANFFDGFIDPFRPIIDAHNSIPFLPDIPVPSGSAALALANIKLPVYGDVFLSNQYTQKGVANAPDVIGIKGAEGFQTLLHEIGHALGLEHPGNYNAGGGGTDPPYLPTEKDNFKYSLMSYTAFYGHQGIFPETPMLYDIAAIQILYGANLQTRTGDDTYSWDQPTVATIWDAGGNDTIDASNQSGSVRINLNAGEFSSIGQNIVRNEVSGVNEVKAMIDNIAIAYDVIIENAVGGQGQDTIIGNSVANFIKGGDGMDRLEGGDGNDTLRGEGQIDFLFGENGNDTLIGGASGDRLNGGEGNDTASYITAPTAILLNLQTGEKTGDAEGDRFVSIEQYRGTLYDDILIGDAGQTIFFGDRGNDLLIGNPGDDILHGDEDNDTVEGRTGNDQIFGEAGNDFLSGNEDNDTLWGGLDDDSLHGNDGNDTLMGDEGQDTLNGNLGDDSLHGNDGNDTLMGDGGNDTLNGNLGDDSLHGNDGNDTMMGDGGNDTLNGNLGDDSLHGNDGNDTMMGDEGQDTLNGNLGDDSLHGNDGNDTLMGDEGHDTLTGDLGDDILRGGTGNDQLEGGDGIDSLYGGFDNDSLRGGIGNDYLFGEEFNDNLSGETGNDYLDGGLGNDILDGGEGEDVLIGSEGRDTITGGQGNDMITGADARDFLTGGTGQDQFIYRNIRDVDDLILDFEVGVDKIVLTNLFQSLNINVVDYADTINQGYIKYGTWANDTILLLDQDGIIGRQRARPFITFDELSVIAVDNANNFVI